MRVWVDEIGFKFRAFPRHPKSELHPRIAALIIQVHYYGFQSGLVFQRSYPLPQIILF
jgi:hypothetical protein